MRPLEDGLEGMIESGKMPDENTPAGAYLKANPAAREEVAEMMEISRLIRENFAVSNEEQEMAEPAPGFYGRVMARIEAQAVPPSIWNFLLEPLGMRLVYASLALAALLFSAMLMDPEPQAPAIAANDSIEQLEGPVVPTTVQGAFLASDRTDVPVVESANPDEDRGTALMQLTTYDQ